MSQQSVDKDLEPSDEVLDPGTPQARPEAPGEASEDAVEGSTQGAALPASTLPGAAGDDAVPADQGADAPEKGADAPENGADAPENGADAPKSGAETPEKGEALLVREGDVAADYLERLLDILDYDGDIDLDVEGDRAVVAVVGGNLRGLIGPAGATLDAVQELTRLAVAQQTGVRTRLMLDVGGFRAKRRIELTDLARRTAEGVLDGGARRKLEPMNPFERKVVHDAISAIDGVVSESEGEEPQRCVVVLPDA